MNKQVIIGFASEGKTDVRFLENIIQRSFEDVAFECLGQVEILPVQRIEKQHGNFTDVVKQYAQTADENGIMVLCVHADADAETDKETFNRIIPAFELVKRTNEPVCKNLVAIVPIQMTEAWMLTDCELLKAEIGTDKSDTELGIYKPPESYADPKQAIETAISIARQDVVKRRRRELKIADLYLPMGQKTAIHKIKILPSYQKFREAVKDAFRLLNYLT
ncbi:MAG: DUF4276 family protein [Chloroflexi bacterium]|nr:MAG: DUF4276 family protein [Chloroflexota bacterium]